MKNTPYVKVYDENGVVVNPIVEKLETKFPNRRQRRQKPARFRRQNKGINLSIVGRFKYQRYIQEIILPTGKIKRIEHNRLKGVDY